MKTRSKQKIQENNSVSQSRKHGNGQSIQTNLIGICVIWLAKRVDFKLSISYALVYDKIANKRTRFFGCDNNREFPRRACALSKECNNNGLGMWRTQANTTVWRKNAEVYHPRSIGANRVIFGVEWGKIWIGKCLKTSEPESVDSES